MVGYGFTILSETPCADPHAGCCGGWGLETPGYPIRRFLILTTVPKVIQALIMMKPDSVVLYQSVQVYCLH